MKWFGKIGFTEQKDNGDGIWDPGIVEREYYGDLTKVSKANQIAGINPDYTISNQLSVLADPFLLDSFQDIVYVTFMKSKWRVSSVEVGYPRLTLTLGSLYEEETPTDNG